jgi:hypothetical protein
MLLTASTRLGGGLRSQRLVRCLRRARVPTPLDGVLSVGVRVGTQARPGPPHSPGTPTRFAPNEFATTGRLPVHLR